MQYSIIVIIFWEWQLKFKKSRDGDILKNFRFAIKTERIEKFCKSPKNQYYVKFKSTKIFLLEILKHNFYPNIEA